MIAVRPVVQLLYPTVSPGVHIVGMSSVTGSNTVYHGLPSNTEGSVYECAVTVQVVLLAESTEVYYTDAYHGMTYTSVA